MWNDLLLFGSLWLMLIGIPTIVAVLASIFAGACGR